MHHQASFSARSRSLSCAVRELEECSENERKDKRPPKNNIWEDNFPDPIMTFFCMK